MEIAPQCPLCKSDNTYFDSSIAHYVCPDCSHEWTNQPDAPSQEDDFDVKDANGNPLQDGDAVILIKDLKVKGSSLVLKKGTKVKNIRLIEGDHNIDCKVDGVALQLKSEFMKKA